MVNSDLYFYFLISSNERGRQDLWNQLELGCGSGGWMVMVAF